MTAFLLWIGCLTAAVADPLPDVVLLSVDTLRADVLGCYGCPHPVTPELDRFSETALVFDDAQCEIPLTAPSFSAMFTGRYPRELGVIRNGLKLPEDMPTLTRAFREHGYYCIAVQSNWTLRGKLCGLNRDFDVYDDELPQKRWGVYRGERRAADLLKAAEKHLKERPEGKPLFAWIHFSDPHAPYRFRRDFDPGGTDFRKGDKKELTRARYMSEVNYCDSHVSALLRALPENTRILFVADHGESLHDHGYLGHGRHVYSECTRIPLMIRSPELKPGRSAYPASSLDVGVTLLALAGLPPLPGMRGANLCRAEGLPMRPRFTETYGGLVPGIPGVRQMLQDTQPLRRAVSFEGWKLHVLSSRQMELYHLTEDPGEEKDLSYRCPERIKVLKALLDEWETTCPAGRAEDASLNRDDLEALRSLGYIE